MMDIRKIVAVYFSPTGGTRKLAERLAVRLAETLGLPWEAFDFTLPKQRLSQRCFSGQELVVFACPTYAGKLPNKILPFVRDGFTASGTPAAALVSFGGRAFDNSLAELCDCLSQRGFRLLGAGAFVCRHAFTDRLAGDRPGEEEYALLDRLAEGILTRMGCIALPRGAASKVEAPSAAPASSGFPSDVSAGVFRASDMQGPVPLKIPGDAGAPYYTPRGLDGEPKVFLKAKPITDPDKCLRCGHCAAVCPMGSIDPSDPAAVTGICIKCHACVRGCPVLAKQFDDAAFLSHRAMLERDYAGREASSELFL